MSIVIEENILKKKQSLLSFAAVEITFLLKLKVEYIHIVIYMYVHTCIFVGIFYVFKMSTSF